MRAAYAALLLGLLGGLGLTAALLPLVGDRPPTVAAALGFEDPDPGLDRRRAEAVAALTATCMHRLGLTWTAVVQPPPAIPDPDLDPVAWADRWGFGVSTMLGLPAPTGTHDMQVAVLAGRSAVEQEAHRKALYGSPGRPGCEETARTAVYGLRDRLLAPLHADLAALEAAIAHDPGSADAEATWGGCVAGISGGTTLDRRSLPASLVESIARRLASLAQDERAVAALQAEERRVAGTIARCEVAFDSTRAIVAARHEAAFVAGHRAALAAIGDAIRSAEAALPTLAP